MLYSKMISEYEQKYSNEINNSPLGSSERKVSKKSDSSRLSHKAPITDQECLYEEIDFSHFNKLTLEIDIIPHNVKGLGTEKPPIYENIHLPHSLLSIPPEKHRIDEEITEKQSLADNFLQTGFFKLNLRPTISSSSQSLHHEENTSSSSYRPSL